jgi:hypothetical protein
MSAEDDAAEAAHALQQAEALEADKAVLAVLTILYERSPGNVGAHIGGATAALTRHAINTLTVAPEVPTVRTVVAAMFPTIQRVAEQLLGRKG